jgi:hypothetical protein
MKSFQQSPGNVRLLSGAITLALAAGAVPLAANADAPRITWRAPVANKVLSGTIGGSSCVVGATAKVGMTRVTTWIGNMQIGSDYSAPFNCTLDTRRLRDGAYTMRTEALSRTGEISRSSIPVRIRNGTSPSTSTSTSTSRTPTTSTPATSRASTAPTAASAISASDIIGEAREDRAFAQQKGYTGQVLGKYPEPAAIPESGIHGAKLPNGETLRLGKVTDPRNAARKALAFQLHPNDPSTSGSKRSELGFGKTIERNKVYWVAFRVFVPDWGSLPSNDVSIFGTQLHSGDNRRGLSPSFSLVANGNGRSFQVYTLYSTASSPTQSSTTTIKHASTPMPFGRWADFVFKFRQNTSGAGFLHAWMDGKQIVNYTGHLGFNTPGFNDYMKFGYYNWSAGFKSSRKVLLHKPTIVLDPTGSKYTAAALRAHVNK